MSAQLAQIADEQTTAFGAPLPTRFLVMGSAEMLSQCWFTENSHFAFPALICGASSGSDVSGTADARSPVQPELVRADVSPALRKMGKRSMMRTTRKISLVSAAAGFAMALMAVAAPAQDMEQTAADAALDLANMLDGAGGGVSGDAYISALENAAEAGQPLALWQLGTMYENGEGVTKDPARAFGYFAEIANQHADTAPKGLEADIVAQSFVKVGDYYRHGLPDAGIPADADRSHALLLHAATYFGDADAQYRVGLLYTEEDGLGVNSLQSARWFSLAARKGHCLAQARLGDMLFNGGAGIESQPVEGLMWLNVSHILCQGTVDQAQIDDLLNRATAVARPEDRSSAIALAQSIAPQFDF